LQALAAACVMDFDDFRAPAAAAELAKRRAAGLTAQQEALLARWGYPYVMEAFRFHMTLTGSLAEDARQAAEAQALARLGGVLAAPMVLDALTLSLQTGPGRPFIAWRRLPFGGRLPIDQGR